MTKSDWQLHVPVKELTRGFLAYLVWAWHWAQPSELPWEKACRVELDDATAWRKRKAVQMLHVTTHGSGAHSEREHRAPAHEGLRGVRGTMTLKAPYFDRLYARRAGPLGIPVPAL